ncbi:MAG: hypothetical protein EOS72_03290 [Mesorhizobium sp.]|uniref:hypothetical protein n=1 Tax=Mesorhizobium sp. TaxID=1871066 RepID=UPI000FE942D5|nr:hypothetical protein [Mesorhizobium sp.]RWC91693.1 MAG: hypothetical protein EOS72_03290 [Mesorhizobium sp.]
MFAITRTEATKLASAEYVGELDKSIDELSDQLAMLQAVRRAVAGTFGFDRRGDEAGTFGQAADAAKRAEYEGEGGQNDQSGRLVPRKAASA